MQNLRRTAFAICFSALCVIACALPTLLYAQAEADVELVRYCRPLGYCFNYPSTLTPDAATAETTEGGKRFAGNRIKASLLEVPNTPTPDAAPYTLAALYRSDVDNAQAGVGSSVTYKLLKSNFYVLSGYTGDNIFYRRVTMKAGFIVCAEVTFASELKDTYNPLIKEMFQDLR